MNRKRLVSLAILVFLFQLFSAQLYIPQANPKTIVISGNARFTVLTSQLIRMEWSKNGRFEDKASLVFINRNMPVPSFKKDESGDWLTITTDKITLHYKKKSGAFSEDNLYITFGLNGRPIKWHPGLKDTLNLKGTTRTLDNTNGEEWKNIHLEEGVLSRSGWTLIDDSQTQLFDGASDWNWVIPRPRGERQDWYFFGYGHDYPKALYDYTLVAGKIPMPPRFAFGYWWSRYWTYSDDELRNLVADIKRFNIPIDVLIIDMDWHNTWGLDYRWKRDIFGEPIGWTGYTWNKNLFPNPEKFLDWAEAQGLKTALNLHPASGIAPMETQYSSFAKEYGFDTTTRQNIPFKIEDKKWTETYFKTVLHPLEKQGVDFWWLDWQQWLGNKTIKGLSNTWWLNYTFFTDMEKQAKNRPFLFHRWGGLGNHRYQVGFSGDALSSWASLAYQPYFTATASNVGYGYWSHDIGGHVASDPDPELYLRWIQFGVFSPILRTHSAKNAYNERRIWKFPEYYKMMLNAYQFRYTLNPYIYTASRETFDTGVSICRPMYYDYPENTEAYEYKGQYMFGNDMLVAPITSKADTVTRLAVKKVWLPKGQWYELFTGTTLDGDRVVERTYVLNEMPVFVKAGSILPMYPEIKNLQRQPDTLVLTVVPGGSGATRVYEDDGDTDDYKNSNYSFTRITKEVADDGSIRLLISPTEGTFKGMHQARYYEIRYPSTFPPAEVVVNGTRFNYSPEPCKQCWTYIGKTLTTIVNIPQTPCTQKLEIRFIPSQQAVGKEALLSGKIGLFAQLPQSVEDMKYESAKVDWAANTPEGLLGLAVIPSRIQYYPQQTVALLEELDKNIMPCLRTLSNFPATDERFLEKVIRPIARDFTILGKPSITITQAAPDKPAKIEIASNEKNVIIHYTTDGTLPDENSPVYNLPFVLTRASLIKARAFRQGDLQSFTSVQNYARITARSVTYEKPYSSKYTGGSTNALIDGMLGEAKNFRQHWIGFDGEDMMATIELVNSDIASITARFMQYQDIWVFLPVYVKYEISEDGGTYKTILEKKIDASLKGDNGIFEYKANVPPGKPVKYIKITAKNIGQCPAWHQGANQKAWLFTDELIVE